MTGPTRRAFVAGAAAAFIIGRAGAQAAGGGMIDATQWQWTYLADTVMGGVSEGSAGFSGGAVRLTGQVSTANNGGFIQVRTAVPAPSDAITALRLRVRGNGQRYFIHLRTTRTRLPWQYYQAGFATSGDWREVTLRLSDFTPSGRMMAGTVRAGDIRSVGLVAFGRDHAADVSLAAMGFV